MWGGGGGGSGGGGSGVSHRSTSSPIGCEAWPVNIGPPRGCPISPTNRPGQPAVPAAVTARRCRNPISSGCPQARLRDCRIPCQLEPSPGSATAPARQPLVYDPIDRGGQGAEPD